MGRLPGWLAFAVLGLLLGFGIWARSAEPLLGSELALGGVPAWRRVVLVPPRVRPPVASPLDRLWAKTEKARANGDVQAALIGLRNT